MTKWKYTVEATCPDCGGKRNIKWWSTKPQSKLCTSCANNRRYEARVERSCSVCGTVRSLRRSEVDRGWGKYCSPKCQHEGYRRTRKGSSNPAWKGGTRRPADRPKWDARLRSNCELCGSDDRIRNHHIIYAQHVRKRGGDEWDPRNAISLCISCHARQHSGTSFRILVCDLPGEFWSFGKELLGDALWDYLARHYDDGNTKLEDLLVNH